MNNEALRFIFEEQKKLNERLGMMYDHEYTDEELNIYEKQYILCLLSELAEALEHTHYRHWKVHQKPIDRNALKIEIIDILHFLVSLALPIMDADEFLSLYKSKMDLNNHRQDVGYSDKYFEKYKQKGREDNDELFNKRMGGVFNEAPWYEGLDKLDERIKKEMEKENSYGCRGMDCYERVGYRVDKIDLEHYEQVYEDGLKVCPKCGTPRPVKCKIGVIRNEGRGKCIPPSIDDIMGE